MSTWSIRIINFHILRQVAMWMVCSSARMVAAPMQCRWTQDGWFLLVTQLRCCFGGLLKWNQMIYQTSCTTMLYQLPFVNICYTVPWNLICSIDIHWLVLKACAFILAKLYNTCHCPIRSISGLSCFPTPRLSSPCGDCGAIYLQEAMWPVETL